MCVDRAEFLPVRSVLVSANVVILCWLCTKLAGAPLVQEGWHGAGSSLISQFKHT